MDLRKLKTLIDLVSESNISELEITEAEGKVRIVKAGLQAAATQPMVMAMAPAQAPVVVAPAAAAAEAPTSPLAVAPPVIPEGKVVKSPMVGTFYRASNPNAKPFAEVGETIKAGAPICIVEAMKIMNEIESDHEGKVVQVLVDNGQPVEYGQPLFVLE